MAARCHLAISWAGAWTWYGLTRLIGAHDLGTWQIFADAISPFIGSPSEVDGGILLDAVCSRARDRGRHGWRSQWRQVRGSLTLR